MDRREVTVHITAWLEAREIVGLEPAFRAVVRTPGEATEALGGADSPESLHRLLDEVLARLATVDGDDG